MRWSTKFDSAQALKEWYFFRIFSIINHSVSLNDSWTMVHVHESELVKRILIAYHITTSAQSVMRSSFGWQHSLEQSTGAVSEPACSSRDVTQFLLIIIICLFVRLNGGKCQISFLGLFCYFLFFIRGHVQGTAHPIPEHPMLFLAAAYDCD